MDPLPIQELTIQTSGNTSIPATMQLGTGTIEQSTPGFEILLVPRDKTVAPSFRLTTPGTISASQFKAMFPDGAFFAVETIPPTGA